MTPKLEVVFSTLWVGRVRHDGHEALGIASRKALKTYVSLLRSRYGLDIKTENKKGEPIDRWSREQRFYRLKRKKK